MVCGLYLKKAVIEHTQSKSLSSRRFRRTLLRKERPAGSPWWSGGQGSPMGLELFPEEIGMVFFAKRATGRISKWPAQLPFLLRGQGQSQGWVSV